MNFNLKYLLAMGLPLVSALAVAGCGQQNASGLSGGPAQSAASQEAPAGSSAQEAAHTHGETESAAGAMKADSPTTKMQFVSQPAQIPAGRSATWTLKIADAKTGAPARDFAVVHDKLMHLIVASRDLSWFNHIHPNYKGGGVFEVKATLPRAGSYKLYADYTPKGQKQEVSQHELATGGAPVAPIEAKLIPDKMQGAWLVKTVSSHPEGEPDAKGGAKYQIAMMPMPMRLKSGQDAMLHFQIRDGQGKPLSDLQPYLGALGHCVILSQDTNKYLHSHPMAEGAEHDMSKMGQPGGSGGMDMSHEEAPKSGGPDVMFHTNFPTPGLYKAWGQFKHRGQIITANFTVNVGPGEPASTSASTSGAQDESKPHTH